VAPGAAAIRTEEDKVPDIVRDIVPDLVRTGFGRGSHHILCATDSEKFGSVAPGAAAIRTEKDKVPDIVRDIVPDLVRSGFGRGSDHILCATVGAFSPFCIIWRGITLSCDNVW